ncbi:MAG: alpha/beta hydrolase [Actinomycetota bacterium]|nr:alpha/beta hydrolase [Actinomycetota bacterium]
MPTVASHDGVSIAAHDLDGEGPDLLLAHATGFHGRVWLPVVAALRSHFRCIAVDERGHGDSGVPPDASFDWRAMAGDLLAVVEAMALPAPFGVGHSAGATLLLLAEQARPGTFRALWCYEPILPPSDDLPPPADRGRLAAGARKRTEVFPSRDHAYRQYASRLPFSALAPDALRAYVDFGFEDLADGTVRLRCRPEHEARVYESGFSHGADRHLDRVRCPVTVACGERTRHVDPVAVRGLAARLPGAGVQVLPGLGHFGPLEDPAAVAEAVLGALSPVSRPVQEHER